MQASKGISIVSTVLVYMMQHQEDLKAFVKSLLMGDEARELTPEEERKVLEYAKMKADIADLKQDQLIEEKGG